MRRAGLSRLPCFLIIKQCSVVKAVNLGEGARSHFTFRFSLTKNYPLTQNFQRALLHYVIILRTVRTEPERFLDKLNLARPLQIASKPSWPWQTRFSQEPTSLLDPGNGDQYKGNDVANGKPPLTEAPATYFLFSLALGNITGIQLGFSCKIFDPVACNTVQEK